MIVSDDEIEAMIKNPAGSSIRSIKICRASDGSLPRNEQVGPTCGLYALDAALQIRGKKIAPRKQSIGDWRTMGIGRTASMRGMAKAKGFTRLGEIGSCRELSELSVACGGGALDIESFRSTDDLWAIVVRAVDGGRGIVFPYAAADNSGTPAWSTGAKGFAHWCLVFGYVDYALSASGSKRVFMTTYGLYLEVSPYRLFKANQNIEDWAQQDWIKVTFWAKPPGKDWEVWKADWQSASGLREDLKLMADNTGPGWGFGIGSSTAVLHKILDPPSVVTDVDVAPATLRAATVKSVVLDAKPYTKSLGGMCVVV